MTTILEKIEEVKEAFVEEPDDGIVMFDPKTWEALKKLILVCGEKIYGQTRQS